MRAILYSVCALCCWLAFSHTALTVAPQKQGEVCPDPSAACASSNYRFNDYELSFRVPKSPDPAVGGFASNSFYAIILKSVRAVTGGGGDDCSFVSEGERKQAQAAFPGSKVFTSRFQCPEQTLLYTNTDQDYNFMAVYAGKTRA